MQQTFIGIFSVQGSRKMDEMDESVILGCSQTEEGESNKEIIKNRVMTALL